MNDQAERLSIEDLRRLARERGVALVKSDIMRPRTVNVERVNDLAKRGIDRIIARHLRRDPAVLERACAQLAAWRAEARSQTHPYYVGAWEEILANCDRETIARLLIERSEHMTELRLSNPFASSVPHDPRLNEVDKRRRLWRTCRWILERAAETQRCSTAYYYDVPKPGSGE